ncbi:uncharacterized protein LOC115382488 [Salarias fasciatus]|uniref:uncharacterized protein LOC115382488 n=1 Tax=Salarias fasciatus TaxID=181472 RepID=UPI00117670B4|nr:uncharacterized protein LOC115382488 [Salarias fasciatus]
MLIFHAGPFLESLSAFICVSLRTAPQLPASRTDNRVFSCCSEEIRAPRPPEAGGRNLQEMDSPPRRRRSRELPFDLSGLVNKLQLDSDSFTSLLNSNEPRMREIVEELLRISEEVKDMQRRADIRRTAGAVGAAGGAALLLLSAAVPVLLPFAAAAGGAAALTGGGAVISANITKMMSESGSAEEVKNLGEELMKIVEPMKQLLVQIHQTCEDLEENVSKYQAEESLKDVEGLQKVLHQVSELKKKSGGAVDVVEVLIQSVTSLLLLLVNVFRVTATPEEDQKLRDAIIQSADQNQRLTEDFCLMREELAKFRK